MKMMTIQKNRIYQDSKELPFLNYKRIIQTGDFYYLVKGYEPGDNIDLDINALKDKFQEIEEHYATSMNVKNSDVLIHGELAIATNEFNKYNILFLFVEQAIKVHELRLKLQALILDLKETGKEEEAEEINDLIILASDEHSDFDSYDIKDLLSDFKVQKSDDLYEQRKYIQNKLDKLNNQILKLNSQIEKNEDTKEDSEFDIDEQFVAVCLGLEIPVDDTKITLFQYGLMVKALMKRVDELNKMKAHAR